MSNFEFSYDFPGASTGARGLVQGGSGSVFFWKRLRLQGAKIMRLLAAPAATYPFFY